MLQIPNNVNDRLIQEYNIPSKPPQSTGGKEIQ